jgi:ribonuclease HI
MENIAETPIIEEIPYNVAVCYADGSAMPNPGFYGTGVHGYIYNTINLDKKNGDKPSKYVISDIGYLEADQLLKYKYRTVIPDYYINGYVSYDGIGTNNIGELNGFIEVITNLMQQTELAIKHYIIKTDSMYLINVEKSILRDTARSWASEFGKPNLQYWHVLEKLILEMKEKDITYEIVKVLGHSTSLGNILADRLALLGRTESTRLNADISIMVTPAKNYWTAKVDRHPFLSFKQLFFTNTLRESNTENLYAVMNYKRDVEPGKKSHEACFGLVLLQEQQTYIESVIDVYQKHLKTLSIIYTANLNDIYSQYAILYNSLFGDKIYNYNRKRGILSVLERLELVYDVRPTGLANQAIDKIMGLYTIIREYRSTDKVHANRLFIDVTDSFYGVDEKGKPVTVIKNGINSVNLEVNAFDTDLFIPIELGKDTLERNVFKRIEKENTKVTLVVTKISPTFIDYYLVVEMVNTGDISVWCNFYNNNILLPKK